MVGKENELKQVLVELMELSRKENSCLEYRLQQDQNNPNQFVLYENWESTALHQEQFNKAYVVRLGKEMESLLAKPSQVIFANEIF